MGPASSQEEYRNSQINRRLKAQHKEESGLLRLLLLGAGESGKTTIFKQMRLSKGRGFNDEYRRDMRLQLFSNLLQGSASLIQGCKDFEVSLTDEDELSSAVNAIKDEVEMLKKTKGRFIDTFSLPANYEMSNDVARAIITLWDSTEVQKVYPLCVKLGEYNLPDTYKDMAEKLRGFPNWGGPSWLPNPNDCLLVRQRTTGMAEAVFKAGDKKLVLIDVGGQKSERKKWVYLFDGVTAVIFVTSLSEYNQTLWEDSSINRLQESLALFKQHAEMDCFKKSAFILFLNKLDLFKEKYLEKGIPINDSGLFPEAPEADMEAEGSCELAKEWFKMKFLEKLSADKRSVIYVQYTNALDTGLMTDVINACADHLLDQSLIKSGIIPRPKFV